MEDQVRSMSFGVMERKRAENPDHLVWGFMFCSAQAMTKGRYDPPTIAPACHVKQANAVGLKHKEMAIVCINCTSMLIEYQS